MRELFLSETPQAFRKIPNRSAAVETLADRSGGAEIPSEKKENSIFSNKSEFVSETTSGRTRIRTWDLYIISVTL